MKHINKITGQKSILLLAWPIIMLLLFLGCQPPKEMGTEKSKGEVVRDLPDVSITSVTKETDFAPHTKVSGTIANNIHFELLLPEDWNGKFVFGGGGGYVGSVMNTALGFGIVEQGYATVGTDTGHEGHPVDGSWAHNDLEAIVNFGHMAVHRTTVNSKAIIEAFYGKKIDYSYFFGCSRGGGQALMEAQRYPEDFDGIVSGAPAYNWTHGVGAGFTHNQQQMFPDPTQLKQALVTVEDLELLETSYLAHCDALDGIEDGIINDPLACDFDINTLLCTDGQNTSCLTLNKIKAIQAVYEGPKNSKGALYYGFPIGGETDPGGWDRWITGGIKDGAVEDFQVGVTTEAEAPSVPNGGFGIGIDMMKYFIYQDPNWNYTEFDFENFDEDSKAIANALNATDPDLSKFRANNGKLLLFTGWSDMAISPLGTLAYYEQVVGLDASATEDVRLFMMPGVMHCAGGPGPWFVNWVEAIDLWVTGQESPDQIPVYFVDEQMQAAGSRLLCAYPEKAIYDGKGDPKKIESFTCGQ